jgi:hypothetical protein
MNQPVPLPLSVGSAARPISDDDVVSLRRWVWRDGLINRNEAEAILSINVGVTEPTTAWTDFFVETLAVWLVDQQEPRGYVCDADADWLLRHLARADGRQTRADLELLVRIEEKALSTPECLRTFALAAMERAAAIDPAEQAWLDARVQADGKVAPYEQALLDFLSGR